MVVAPEAIQELEELTDKILPAWRPEQGIRELEQNGIDATDMKNIGHYLKWIGADVKKEELDTVEASGRAWKAVSKYVSNRAKRHYMKGVKSI